MRSLMSGFVVAVMVVTMSATPLAASRATLAGEQDFTLVNATGLVIDELYVSPSDEDEWEEDVLGVETLDDGDSADISFSRDTDACEWDLKIVDEEGDAVVWAGIDLCKASEITLHYRDGRPTASVK